MHNTIDFIETAWLMLSNQEVVDELKNNYYKSAAKDPDARTTDGMMSFASEWINTVIDNYPNFKDVSESEIHIVKRWIVLKILFPIVLHIEMGQEARKSEKH